jgi:hypothetical protein
VRMPHTRTRCGTASACSRIRQHTSAYLCGCPTRGRGVAQQAHALAYVSIRQHTCADAPHADEEWHSKRMLLSRHEHARRDHQRVCIRQHTSAYVSICERMLSPRHEHARRDHQRVCHRGNARFTCFNSTKALDLLTLLVQKYKY